MYFASFAFLPEKPCQTGTLVKRLLLMLINVGVSPNRLHHPTSAPSVLQEGSSDGNASHAPTGRRIPLDSGATSRLTEITERSGVPTTSDQSLSSKARRRPF